MSSMNRVDKVLTCFDRRAASWCTVGTVYTAHTAEKLEKYRSLRRVKKDLRDLRCTGSFRVSKLARGLVFASQVELQGH